MHVVLMIYCSSFDEYKQVKFTRCSISLWRTVCFVICKIIHTFWFIYLIMFTLFLRIFPHTYGSVCSIIFKASNLWSIKVSFLVHDYTILEFIFSFPKMRSLRSWFLNHFKCGFTWYRRLRLDEICVQRFPQYSRTMIQSWILRGKNLISDIFDSKSG